MSQQKFEVSLHGGDRIAVTVESDGSVIKSTSWQMIGSLELIQAAQKLKGSIKGDVLAIPVPQGTEPAQLLLKKLILKIKGQWLDEEGDPELCHCRKIPQAHVERAIVLGAHSVEKVRLRTSANTGCGTCLPDVEKILEIYLKNAI
jgi:bacterioferritin-associated ferredoxin